MKFSRQVRVIGRDGQERLEAAEIVVARGDAGEIEARYLAAAGARVREGDVSIEDARFADMHAAARDVALGARAACVAIMNVVR
ncbi:MAG TPA: hypothetical protein VGH87_23535 [Polyangiaceae bacterium]|jgi:hypothetical protein|nr:hypothetical protein [Polyangiaceae bacterium]